MKEESTENLQEHPNISVGEEETERGKSQYQKTDSGWGKCTISESDVKRENGGNDVCWW